MSAIRRLDGLTVVARFALVAAIFTGILAADYATGIDVALRALYVLPVGLASWLLGRRVGIFVGVLAASACVVFDWRAGLGGAHRVFLYSDAAMRVLTYAAGAHIIDRLRSAHRELDTLAHNDALTGIANLRAFREVAERERNRSQRFGAPFSIAQIDVDGFKTVNDTRGHAEGDRILVAVAAILASGRVLDLAARIGGDEFVLLLPDTDRTEAETVIARVRERLSDAMLGGGWPVTFSIGVATFLSAPESLDRALEAADGLLYDVKRATKNGARFEEVGERPSGKTRATERALRR